MQRRRAGGLKRKTPWRVGTTHMVMSPLDFTQWLGISQVFGVSPAPSANWPIDANDSNGALLVRAIGEKLQLGAQQTITEEKFQQCRRVAHRAATP